MDKPEFRVERGPDTTNEEAAIGMAKLLERGGRTVAADMLRQLHAENERLAALVAEHQQTLALQQRSYEREIQLEVEAEREACAKLAESTVCDTHLPTGVRIYGTRAAAAIRSRTP